MVLDHEVDCSSDSDASEELYSRCSSTSAPHSSYTDVQHTGNTGVYTHNTCRNSRKTRLAVAAVLSFVFMVVQAAGSWVSGSVSVLYDSGHLLCDACGLLAVLAAAVASKKSPSQRYPFGWLRAEVLGGLATLQLMWVVTALLVYESAMRVSSLQYVALDPDLMIVSAVLGFAGYFVLVLILRGVGSPIKSPQTSLTNSLWRASEQTTPFLEETCTCCTSTCAFIARVTLLHVYCDCAMAACVLLAALVIRVQPAWKLLDPVLTVLGGGAVVASSFPALRRTMLVLMEGCPAHISMPAVQAALEQIHGVHKVQSVQIWSLNFSVSAASVIIVAGLGCDLTSVQQRVAQLLQQRFSVQWCAVQVNSIDKLVHCTTLITKTAP